MTRWYLEPLSRPAARLRLYCLPCAGAGASMYRTWPAQLPDWVEVRPVRLPGRQGRHREESFVNADTAAGVLADQLLPGLHGRYALFGHSMGALLAYLMVRILHRTGGPLPVLLAVASWPVTGSAPAATPDPDDTDSRFTTRVRELGGAPAEILDDPAMLRLTLPVLRADFRLCRSYIDRPEPPLPMPVSAYGGVDDRVTPPDGLELWKEHTNRFLGLRLYPGGHFFLHDQERRMLADLAADLEEVG